MAINRTFVVAPPSLILPYAGQVGTAVGTKKNVLTSLEAGQRTAELRQRGSLAMAEMNQRGALAEMDFANAREQRLAQLAANQMDNERMLAQEQMGAEARLAQEDLQQNRLDQRAAQNADLRARNEAMKGGGLYVPDVRDGDLQNFSAAVDNQHVFTTAAAGQSGKLLEKFRAGDPQAIDAALQSGRATLNATDRRMLQQAEAAMSRTYVDRTLRPDERAAVQAQLAQQIQGIKKRAQLLPDEMQPKSIQERAQSSVVVLQDPTQQGKTYAAFVDPKGNIKPLHELERESKPDPNAPKPVDPEKRRQALERSYDEAFKALQIKKTNPTTGDVGEVTDQEVLDYLEKKRGVVDKLMGESPTTTTEQPQTDVVGSITSTLRGMFGGGGTAQGGSPQQQSLRDIAASANPSTNAIGVSADQMRAATRAAPSVPSKADRQRPRAMREWLASQGLVDDTGMSDRDWAVLPSDAAQQAVNGIFARANQPKPIPITAGMNPSQLIVGRRYTFVVDGKPVVAVWDGKEFDDQG